MTNKIARIVSPLLIVLIFINLTFSIYGISLGQISSPIMILVSTIPVVMVWVDVVRMNARHNAYLVKSKQVIIEMTAMQIEYSAYGYEYSRSRAMVLIEKAMKLQKEIERNG